jgi:hypothetical protein
MANKKIPAKLTMRQAFKAAQGPLDLEDEEDSEEEYKAMPKVKKSIKKAKGK